MGDEQKYKTTISGVPVEGVRYSWLTKMYIRSLIGSLPAGKSFTYR